MAISEQTQKKLIPHRNISESHKKNIRLSVPCGPKGNQNKRQSKTANFGLTVHN